MSIWRQVNFLHLISRQRYAFAYSEVNYDPIFLNYALLKSRWNCASFGGSFSRLWVVLANYDQLKASWVLEVDFKTNVYFCTFWGQFWSDLSFLHNVRQIIETTHCLVLHYFVLLVWATLIPNYPHYFLNKIWRGTL